jgi:uncharacterized repeat protein (TIGR02543 family)
MAAALLIGAQPAQAAACSPTITTSGGFTRVAFNTVGTCDWTVPAGIYEVEVLIVGGGGGGGGGATNNAGGGGGGGQVRILTNQAVTPGATLSNITVGAGGTAGAVSSAGGTGGSSAITIGGTTLTSSGGAGGASATFTSGGAPAGGANGGGNAGGTAASYSGYANGGGGGGASAAGSGRNGGAGTTWQGSSTAFGSGGGGGSFYVTAGTTSANAQGKGGSGAANGGYLDSSLGQLCGYSGFATYGGGGGGACRSFLGANCVGGAGGSGTVKLRYAVPQTVTFNANGGTGSLTSQQSNIAMALTSNTTQITRSGYTFAGWATTPGGSVAYANGAIYPFTSSTTLYAVWAAITYDANGGTGSMSNTTGTPGSSVNLSANGFSPVGSPTPTFRGWDTNPNASPASPTYAAGQPITMPSGVLALYAIWDPPIITSITYNANGGGGSETTQTGAVGTSVTLASGSGMSYPGYTLASWNTAANGSGTTYALGSTITLPSGGLALYAQWNALPVITYDANGGTGSVADQTAAVGASVTLDSGSGLSGGANTFLGWSADPNATTPTYTASQSIAMPAGGLTLYAIWDPPIVRTVLYNSNGGTGSEASQSDVVDDPVTLASGGGMSYAGRTLLGWDTNPGATTPTYALGEAITMPANGLALYAIWSAPEVPPVPLWTLTYDGNGGSCSKASDQAYDSAWLTLPDSSACTRSGFLFTGWNTAANGSGLAFTTGGATQMTGDNTLYAQWRKITLPLLPPSPTPTPSPSVSPSPSASPSASPSVSPSASPSVSPAASPSASPAETPAPTPSGSPGSDGAGPIAAPTPAPTSDGVTILPKRGTITQPDGGSVDPTEGGTPSTGASFSGDSIAIWDGTKWTQSYTDPGVGTWLVVNGQVRFVPVPGFVGTASTTMRVIDNSGKAGYAPVSFTVLPPAQPTPPPALPDRGSAGLGPIPPPPALPAADAGAVVQPQGAVLNGPSGTADPVADAIPSPGASIDPSSLLIWDGASWVKSYDDPGVGSWKVVDGKVVFTPVPGFCGTASTTMKLTDTAGKSGTAPVAFTVPCPKAGSNGTGIVPGPPTPPFDGSSAPMNSSVSLSGVANADGGAIDAATALASYGADLSTLRIWDGTAWVREFTDPGVGTWRILGTRIIFTPAKGFTGVARTTFRAVAADGSTIQGPVSFTVEAGCSLPTGTQIVIGFEPNDATIGKADRTRLSRALSPACRFVVSGFVQPVGSTSNDRSLSLGRAQVVADLIREEDERLKVRVVAGGRWLQDACARDENRCAIVRPARAVD